METDGPGPCRLTSPGEPFLPAAQSTPALDATFDAARSVAFDVSLSRCSFSGRPSAIEAALACPRSSCATRGDETIACAALRAARSARHPLPALSTVPKSLASALASEGPMP